MKTSEILLASAVLSIVAGGGAALAAGAFLGTTSARVEGAAVRSVSAESRAADGAPLDVAHELDQLRLENSGLRLKLDELERRLSDSLTARVPLESAPLESASAASDSPELAALLAGDVTPDFVARVDQAMATIKAREDAEREVKRKELQAQRIEQRIADLQTKLGLNSRQASDLRTVLIDEDDRREKLFASVRDSQEPRDMREGFRTIRDETYAALERVLTPEQFEGYKQSEEREWGRGPGGGGRGGPPGGFGGFTGGGDGRPQRQGQ